MDGRFHDDPQLDPNPALDSAIRSWPDDKSGEILPIDTSGGVGI